MEFVIADDAEHEELYADIFDPRDHYNWARVIYDTDKAVFTLTISPPLTGNIHVFALEEVLRVLERAKRRLMEMGYGEAV